MYLGLFLLGFRSEGAGPGIGVFKPTQAGVSPSAHGGRAWYVGKEAAMAASASSTNVPGCGAPNSCPSRLSCAANGSLLPGSALQRHVPAPSPFCTGRHTSQVGVCRAEAGTICVSHTLSCLPQTSCCDLLQFPEAPLLSQLISPPGRGLPWVWEPPHSFSSPKGAQVPSPFLFFLFLSLVLPGYAGTFLALSGV